MSWIVPAGIGAITIAVVAAVIIARTERPSRTLVAVTPAILQAAEGTPPEIAAINAQLAQIKELQAHALFGAGVSNVVRAPIPSLRPALGEQWHELSGPVGRVYLRPTGVRSAYFEASMVVVAQHGPARLELLTSEGQHAVEQIGTSKQFKVVTFGPLRAPATGGVGIALSTSQPTGESPGPPLVISPIQSEYRASGEWIEVMPALQEPGPKGQRGIYLAAGSTTQFALTPGVNTRPTLVLLAASLGGMLDATFTLGKEAQSARIGATLASVQVGPFKRGSEVVSVRVAAPATPKSSAFMFVAGMRLVASPR